MAGPLPQPVKVYRVGGSVRDELLGRPVADHDYVVVGRTPEMMLASGFRPVGRDFPVFLHPDTHEEYALARTERKHGTGYRGFEFFASPDVTLEEDLERRDLTINAMARGDAGTLIDPHGGRDDLAAGVLRHVSTAFAEDPLRVLRVARFAARFGFVVAPATEALMRTLVDSGELATLASERVWQELARGLMEAHPSRMLAVLRDCGALAALLPEVDALFGIPQPPAHHPEVDTGVARAAGARLGRRAWPAAAGALCRAHARPRQGALGCVGAAATHRPRAAQRPHGGRARAATAGSAWSAAMPRCWWRAITARSIAPPSCGRLRSSTCWERPTHCAVPNGSTCCWPRARPMHARDLMRHRTTRPTQCCVVRSRWYVAWMRAQSRARSRPVPRPEPCNAMMRFRRPCGLHVCARFATTPRRGIPLRHRAAQSTVRARYGRRSPASRRRPGASARAAEAATTSRRLPVPSRHDAPRRRAWSRRPRGSSGPGTAGDRGAW